MFPLLLKREAGMKPGKHRPVISQYTQFSKTLFALFLCRPFQNQIAFVTITCLKLKAWNGIRCIAKHLADL